MFLVYIFLVKYPFSHFIFIYINLIYILENLIQSKTYLFVSVSVTMLNMCHMSVLELFIFFIFFKLKVCHVSS